MCLHQSASSVLCRNVPVKYYRTISPCSLLLTSQVPLIQLITTFESPKISSGDYQGTNSLARDCCHLRSLFTLQEISNSALHAKHVQIHCQRAPLRPSFARLYFRHPGISKQSRKGSFEIRCTSCQWAPPFCAVFRIIVCQFYIGLPPLVVTAPCHHFLPLSAFFQHHRENAPFSDAPHRMCLNSHLAMFLLISSPSQA